jgi:hypothetical protein
LMEPRSTNNGPNGGIHTWGVSPRSQYGNLLHFYGAPPT